MAEFSTQLYHCKARVTTLNQHLSLWILDILKCYLSLNLPQFLSRALEISDMHVWKSMWWSWRHFHLLSFCPHNEVRIWLCIPCASDITSVTVYSGPEESSIGIQQKKGKIKRTSQKFIKGKAILVCDGNQRSLSWGLKRTPSADFPLDEKKLVMF